MAFVSRWGLGLVILTGVAGIVCGEKIISETTARLPMSLSTVITDLEAEGVSALTMACFIPSRSVTSIKRGEVLERMFGGSGDGSLSSAKAFGTAEGLAIAQPPTAWASRNVYEVASTALACGGNILYYPSPEDLSRGEGLFEGLAPAMERILSMKRKEHDDDVYGDKVKTTTTLIVVVEEDVEQTRLKLESACEAVLVNFVESDQRSSSGAPPAATATAHHEHKLSVLEDIFDHVLFVHPSKVVETLMTHVHDKSNQSPSEAASAVAACVSSALLSTTVLSTQSPNSPPELAAARKIGPIARKAVSSAIQKVKEATNSGKTSDSNDSSDALLVSNFGSLCDAAITQAFQELEKDSAMLSTTNIGKQIKDNLENELYEELGHLFEEQLEQLVLVSFDQFKQGLSKLRVSPNLEQEMEDVVTTTIKTFVTKAKQLQMRSKNKQIKRLSEWPFTHVTKKFQKQLTNYCSDRLLAAEASGQFKPLPRKGVTVGFHWLLPKPFGNDYRQEPWMVHATDNMVYIPKDKLTDVAVSDIPSNDDAGSANDWRTKIVPSPAGNDMLYMQ